MKLSIAIAAVILALGLAFGWHGHRQLASARLAYGKLAAEAARLGISVDPARPAVSARITKRGREDGAAEAKQAAADFIVFATEMEASQENGASPDAAMQKRIMEFMERMMSLDGAQLKILIAEVRAANGLKEETRQNLIGFSMMTLANDHPQAALAILTESSDLFKDGQMGEYVITTALSRWAQDDPMAALAWMRKNEKKFPDLITEDAKLGFVSGAAANDPKLAFKLISELGLKESSQAVSSILSHAKTADERTASLYAFRDYVASLPDEKARDEASKAVSELAHAVLKDGFEPAMKWLETAKLTPAELADFAQGLRHNVKSADTGQWISWVERNLPPEERDSQVEQLVRNWTQNDYQAAGQWLSTVPEGPAKTASVKAYATTISEYEPEVAAQWAVTLPEGNERTDTLRQIHENWPTKDPAAKEAAAAFAKEHGIE